MPPRAVPKVFQILVKTHQLTIFLSAPSETTIGSLKADAFSALASDVNQAEGVPKVGSVAEFELCRGVKERGRSGVVGYEVLGHSDTVKGVLSNWEHVFVQFRDGAGELVPVEVTLPSLLGEDDDESPAAPRAAAAAEETASKGKRKAAPE